MKVTLVAAMSIDGKITRGEEQDVSKWTSLEDKAFLHTMITKNNLFVMGSGTYEVVKKILTHTSERLRVVMTKRPEKYKNDFIKGQLEFSDLSPTSLVKNLSERGFKQMLLLGGAKIYGIFLNENLVDEIYLTLEPKIFGIGKPLVDLQELNIQLKLQSVKKLNEQGSLLLHYFLDQ